MEKDALWVKVLNKKYCSNCRLKAKNGDRLPCSRAWKAMKIGGEVFKKGSRWIPGRNSTLSVWHDNWVPNGSLRSIIHGPLTVEDESLRGKDVFGPHGWDWSRISFVLPSQVLMDINSIPCSIRANQEGDRLFWVGAKKGDFDLNYAYSIASSSVVDGSSFLGSWVWKLDTLPRIKTFIWQCLHDSIGVGECLVRRCIKDSATCLLCQREPESILHRLKDCEVAKLTWGQWGIHEYNNFYEGNLSSWLEKNCKFIGNRVGSQPPWSMVFPFPIWLM